jgi:hypothetical protein
LIAVIIDQFWLLFWQQHKHAAGLLFWQQHKHAAGAACEPFLKPCFVSHASKEKHLFGEKRLKTQASGYGMLQNQNFIKGVCVSTMTLSPIVAVAVAVAVAVVVALLKYYLGNGRRSFAV